MATQNLTLTAPDTNFAGARTLLGTNAIPLANGDNTSSVPVLGYDEITVAVVGTFGVGGSVAVEGSLDNSTFFALPNLAGTAIAITAAGIAVVGTSGVRYVRARVTAGDGTTSLTASIFLKTRNRAA